MDASGNLYGTTVRGTPTNNTGGTVFELSPSGGGWTHQVIYAPGTITGSGIYAGLTMDSAGNIFGSTDSAAFELSPNGSGGWNPTVLHTFIGGPKDGYNSDGDTVLDKNGSVYGTTGNGGSKNCGIVYKLTPITKGKKKGTWTEKILYSFKGKKDGASPLGKIVFDAAGNIYGGTQQGGKPNAGTVFELVAPLAKGAYKERVLWTFSGNDGHRLEGGVIIDSGGNLFGTTSGGGSSGNGVVFEVTP